MEKERFIDSILDLKLQGNIEDSQSDSDEDQFIGLFQYGDSDIFHQNVQKKQSRKKTMSQNNEQYLYTPMEKQQLPTQMQLQFKQSKSTEKYQSETNLLTIPKNLKQEKQHQYSKVYRKKKKQKYRLLQEQNEYLRKRISELQNQLRQQEIQLNRFKFPPPQKQLSIEELNSQLSQISTHLSEKYKDRPADYYQPQLPDQNCFRQSFLESYAKRGFAGKKKLKILNYHFNQILEAVMKDSEKYFSLLYAGSKSYDKLAPVPQFQPINNICLEIYKPEGNLWSRLKQIHKVFKPLILQLNLHISQFYSKFQDILKCCNTIHNFIRDTYLANMDVARKRLQLQKWFQFSKYGKLMRRLRFKWFQWMKSLAQKQNQENKTTKRTYKKKKILQ